MTFDAGNPYRRKSSLVASDAKPMRQRPSRRDECIVHQFLDGQRRAQDASDADGPHYAAHPIYANSKNHYHVDLDPVTEKDNEKDGQHAVEPKSKQSLRCVVDPKSLDPTVSGQPDQQAWTHEMTKELSDLDLSPPRQDDMHSRLLTKKQLSDMAWGVRELSRRLSSIRIRLRVKNIFLLTKIYDQDLVPKTRELTRWLLDKDRDVRYNVYVQDKIKTNKKFDLAGLVTELAQSNGQAEDMDEAAAREDIQHRLRYWDEGMCRTRPHTFDLVITLGGDGTVLYASWLFQRIVPPVLSFALGSLGFLTKFDFEEYQPTLDTAFNRGVTVSLRLRFEGTVMRSQRKPREELSGGSSEEEEDELQHGRDLVEELIGEEREDAHTHRPEGTFEILNEIVVDRGPNPSK